MTPTVDPTPLIPHYGFKTGMETLKKISPGPVEKDIEC